MSVIRVMSLPSTPDASAGASVVLVVDDEPIVRRTASLMLQRLGFRVVEAESGAQALQLYGSSPVDAVLLDMSMPVMSGEDTFRQLLVLDPNVRVIVSTGYGEDYAMERLGLQIVLRKPYTSQRLLEVVNEALTPNKATDVMRNGAQ